MKFSGTKRLQTLTMRLGCRGLVLAAALSSLSAMANGVLIAPGQPVAGQTQLALADQFGQWAFGAPTATNPITDPTGSFANLNNNGNVFLLAGGSANTPFSRDITVPFGKPLFFPLLNYIDVETVLYPPYCPPDVDCALNNLRPFVNNPKELHVALDGTRYDLTALAASLRQTSNAYFYLNLTSDNLFGLPADLYPSVLDGFYAAVLPLERGTHVLEFGGTWADGSTVSVTDTLNVVPEPPTSLLLLPGLLALLAVKRRENLAASGLNRIKLASSPYR